MSNESYTVICRTCGRLYDPRNVHKCEGSIKLSTGADPVNHPAHYTNNLSGVEVIQITRHMNFNLGNAVKYILRADHKGSTIQDLNKAIWYLVDEIQRRQGTVTVDTKEQHK